MSRVLWIASLPLWIAVTGWGVWKALEYDSTPAAVVNSPDCWPEDCLVSRDSNRPTLVVFVHPKCPCTRATIHELGKLLAHHRDRLALRAIILHPDGTPDGWAQTDLVAQVNALADVEVITDFGGICSQQFRTSTSGECLLYDTSGRLRFHGGITRFRGHQGPSIGQDAISAVLTNTPVSTTTAPVFGCALHSPAPIPPANVSP